MLNNDFKNQLNQFLIDSGMSKNALAKELNISQSQVSNWSNFGLKRWTKNSKKLSDYLRYYYQDNFEIPIEIEQILRHILCKNPQNKERILTILNSINSLELKDDNEKQR